MNEHIEGKSKIRNNEPGATGVLASLSFDQIFGSITGANTQKTKYGKWGLKNELSKWY